MYAMAQAGPGVINAFDAHEFVMSADLPEAPVIQYTNKLTVCLIVLMR